MCAKWWLKKKKEEEEEEKEEGNNALVKSFISVLIKGLIFSRCWPVNPPPTCVARQLFFQLLFRSQRVELLLAFGHQALWTASAGYCQLSFMRLVKRDPFSSPLNRKWSEWELGNVNRLNRKALHFSIAESWLVDQRFDYAKGGGSVFYSSGQQNWQHSSEEPSFCATRVEMVPLFGILNKHTDYWSVSGDLFRLECVRECVCVFLLFF